MVFSVLKVFMTISDYLFRIVSQTNKNVFYEKKFVSAEWFYGEKKVTSYESLRELWCLIQKQTNNIDDT